jgi:hypothetical protein
MFSTARWRTVFAACLLSPIAVVYAQAPASDATLFRVFLTDGSTLVSYGEFARVADRVVLSLPLGGTSAAPRLQLLSIPAASVNWEQTDAYAEAARAARFAATRGPDEFALLGQAVTRALSDIAVTADRDRKLAMAVEARQNVTRWAAEHYAYRSADVAQLATLFDDVIAEVRSAGNGRAVDFTLVANITPPPAVPLMSAPDLRESADQALRAATLVPDASERTSLLRAIADSLTGSTTTTAEWVVPFKGRVLSALATEERVDRGYATLTQDLVRAADRYARDANVAAMRSLQQRALAEDERLGRQRPREMAALLASLDSKLDAARRLRLARDQWAARLEVLKEFEAALAEPAAMLRACRTRLEAVRQLDSTPRRSLVWLEGQTSMVTRLLAAVKPPAGGETVYGLFISATQLATRAVTSRQQAVSTGEMQPAWEAASAAAGALMMIERATTELQKLSTAPDRP